MSARTCPECGEVVTYPSCQQPDTEAIAELALLVHRKEAHGAVEPVTPELFGRAFAEAMDAREAGR